MKKQTLTAALLLTLFFSAIAGAVSVSRAVELTAQEKTLAFLSDVVMIDLSKYNVTLRKDNMTYPAEYGGVPREDVTYRLQTDSIDLSADCVYLNQTLWRCQINLHGARPADSLIYSQPLPADVVGLAKIVLEKYQDCKKSPVYQPMRDLLASVEKTENVTVASDEYRLDIKIIHSGRSVAFDWVVGEGDLEETALGMVFQDGALYVINDLIGIFNFTNAKVTVSEKEAIDIAIEQALNCSWTVIVDGSQQSVMAEGIASVPPTTKLSLTVYPSRDPFIYYPFWRVNVWLDKTYAGGVSYISVGIWADTGEVVYVKALGGGGGVPSSEGTGTSSSTNAPSQPPSSTLDPSVPSEIGITPNETPSPQQQPNDAKAAPTGNYPLVAVAAAATIGAAATAALYLKKRRRQHR